MWRSLRLGLLLTVTALSSCQQWAPIAHFLGFTALRPPSNLYQAGAVVAVEYVGSSEGRAVSGLKLVCGPRASLGASWLPTESQTLAGTQRTTRKESWHIEGAALEKIKSRTELQEVTDVSVTLENARILEMQDTDVWENVAQRSEECRRAIQARLDAGFEVTMVSSNIVADITYNVTFSRTAKMDKKTQMDRMHELAVTLGGGHTYIDEHQIQATNLAVGIKTDAFLLAISLGADQEQLLEMRQPRALHAVELDADARPDAPVVHAPGGQVQRVRGAPR